MTAANATIRAADAAAIGTAARLIRDGRLVAFPTETVYGLGCDATNDRAVAAVFAAKGRPNFNPLIVHFADADAAEREALFNDRARAVAKALWPGPITIVLPRRAGCRLSRLASAGLDTVAVRVPAHDVAHA
ncbi:MAG: translation factor Sua5, partial [Alphaproteobacteria bacterium]|nr:translation factor Sua5 [Alphaproteobacteria bacterium]